MALRWTILSRSLKTRAVSAANYSAGTDLRPYQQRRSGRYTWSKSFILKEVNLPVSRI
jgi:hypothetical protein